MPLSRISRYLLREAGQAWIGITVVLIVVLLTNRLAHYLGDAVSGDVPAGAIFTLLGLKIVSYLGSLLPAGFFLGVLIALGRLYRDSEMAALTACGVGPGRIYQALMLIAVPLTLLVAWCSLVLAPWAERTAERVLVEAQQEVELQGAQPGRFLSVADGSAVVYVGGQGEDGAMRGIFAAVDRDGRMSVVLADSARRRLEPASGDDFLVLRDGRRYDGVPGARDWRRIAFAEHGIRLSDPAPARVETGQRGMTAVELWRSGTPEDMAELQWRLSLPLTTVVLMLIAVPLAKSAPREGRYARLVSAVFIFMLYLNGLKAAEDWLEDGRYPAAVGLWWVHLLFLAFGVVLLVARHRVLHRHARRVG